MGLLLRRELTDIRLESATIATEKESGGINEMNIIFKRRTIYTCRMRGQLLILGNNYQGRLIDNDKKANLRATHQASDLPAPTLY